MARRLLLLGALVAAFGPLAVPAARSADPPAYFLTLAARVCSGYGSVTANINRSNASESLDALGPDSAYVPGRPVDPATETEQQPGCRPLPGWQFTLGSGVRGPAPATDHLSTVTAARSPLTVQPSAPLLDADGNPTGDQIDAAVTVAIEGEDLERALRGRSLWVQGGQPGDPLLDAAFPAEYGFGGLRCAIDNLDGDNVEWVGYPAGVHHVFCFYYAVSPPPAAGTITVRKEIPTRRTDNQTFRFAGDMSYEPGGAFTVGVRNGEPGSIRFVRAGGRTWSFTAEPTAGWTLSSLTCASATGESTWSVTGARATVDLAALDQVTCTSVDRPHVADLSVLTQTVGGVGGPFTFAVTNPAGATSVAGSATTTEVNEPVLAGTVGNALPGTYTVTELPPPGKSGDWTLALVECNGRRVPIIGGNTVTVAVASPSDPIGCIFTNRLRSGSLAIRRATAGGTGTAGFVVVPAGGTSDGVAVLSATTTAPDVAAGAKQVAGPPVGTLPLGTYFVFEVGPDDSDTGQWSQAASACGKVELTLARPDATCLFTSRFAPYGFFTLVRQVVDPHGLRHGPLRLTVTCRQPGGAGGTELKLTAPEDRPGPFSVGPVRFEQTASCSIGGVRTGAAPGGAKTVQATLTRNGTAAPIALPATDIAVVPGDDVRVEVTDTYGSGTPASTTPSTRVAGQTASAGTAEIRTLAEDLPAEPPPTGPPPGPPVRVGPLLLGAGLVLSVLAIGGATGRGRSVR